MAYSVFIDEIGRNRQRVDEKDSLSDADQNSHL